MMRMVVLAVLCVSRRRGSAEDVFDELPADRLLAFWRRGLLLLLLLLLLLMGEVGLLLLWCLSLCLCTRITEILQRTESEPVSLLLLEELLLLLLLLVRGLLRVRVLRGDGRDLRPLRIALGLGAGHRVGKVEIPRGLARLERAGHGVGMLQRRNVWGMDAAGAGVVVEVWRRWRGLLLLLMLLLKGFARAEGWVGQGDWGVCCTSTRATRARARTRTRRTHTPTRSRR